MTSFLSTSFLPDGITTRPTNLQVNVANDGKLHVKGTKAFDVQLEGATAPQKAVFVVTDQKWRRHDAIIGNDIIMKNGGVIDYENMVLKHKLGVTPIELSQQTIRDLFHLPLEEKPGPAERPADVELSTVAGQAMPKRSTKIIRFKTLTPVEKGTSLLLPKLCIHALGVWVPTCIVTIDENSEFLVQATNTSDQNVTLPEVTAWADIMDDIEANILTIDDLEASLASMMTDLSRKVRRSKRFKKTVKKIAREAKCSKGMQKSLVKLLLEFPDVLAFKDEAIGKSRLFKQDIPLTTDKAIRVAQYPIPKKLREPLMEWVKEMLQYGVIRPSRSPYNSPCLLVRKKNGEWRTVVDFRRLNEFLAHDPYLLPKINELLTSLGPISKKTFFSALDLLWGFFHIELNEEDKQKTAFSTPLGRFEYNRMPMGLKTAPAAFQRLVDLAIMQAMPYPTACYIDDILLASGGEEIHLEHLHCLLKRLRETGLKLKVEKCEFFQEEVTFLGHKLTRDGVTACHDKVEKIVNFPAPTNIDELRSFLGLASYYRKFVDDFAKIARPLTENLKQNKTYEWGTKQEKAFSELKEALSQAPTLAYPQEGQPYYVTVGYTDKTISAILSQKVDRAEKPLNFVSRSLQGAELNYYEKHGPEEVEMLAIHYGLTQFYPEIYSKPIVVRGRSKVIEVLTKKQKAASQRTAKWINMLRNFPDMTFEVVKESKIRPAQELAEIEKRLANSVPPTHQERLLEAQATYSYLLDCSQAEVTQSAENDKPQMDEQGGFRDQIFEFEESIYLSPSFNADGYVPVLFPEFWRDLQAKDTFCNVMKKQIREGKTMQYQVDGEGLLRRVAGDENRLVIPYLGRDTLTHLFHAPPRRGHYDGKRTFEAARPYAYWPNMQREVIQFCQHCSRCQYYNKRARKPGPYPRSLPEKPWQMTSADLKGPLPPSSKGHRYVLVMQDQLSRFLKLVPLKGPTADEVAIHFIDRIIREEGTPEVILSDQGTHFIAKLYKLICNHLGVNHITTTTYHPQSNGANERSHKELARFLSIYTEKRRPEDWHLLVKEAEWAHNTTYHASLKRSPYEALRGFAPPLHGLGAALKAKNKIMEEALDASEPDASDQKVLEKYFVLLDKEVIQARDEVYKHLNRVQEQYRQAMLLEQNKYLDVEPGALVLLSTPGTAIKDALKKYTGPYRVVRRYSDAVYKIEDLDGKRYQVVNQIRLKRYFPPNKIDEANLPIPEMPKPPPPKRKVSPIEPLNPAIIDDPSFIPERTHPMVLRSQARAAPDQSSVPVQTPATPVQPARVHWRQRLTDTLGRTIGRLRNRTND